MSQKSGNNVKPPVHAEKRATIERPRDEAPDEQHHGENTKSLQDAKRIGQSQGTGRPPLLKK